MPGFNMTGSVMHQAPQLNYHALLKGVLDSSVGKRVSCLVSVKELKQMFGLINRVDLR